MSAVMFVYISCWKKGGGTVPAGSEYGLSGYRFDAETGEMIFIEKVRPEVLFNVSYFDSKRNVLYALEESNDLPQLRVGGGGRVFAFKVDPHTGKLEEIGCSPTWGASPCYLTLDASGKYMLIAHHGCNAAVTKIGQDAHGNYYPLVELDDVPVVLFAVNEDGTLGKVLDVVKHTGSGPEKRQLHAHPHTTVMSPSGRLFAVCDKGNDTVRMYGLDQENGKLIRPKHLQVYEPGTLPRYCVFHPEKPWLYHNNEKSMNFYSLTYDEAGFLQNNHVCNAMPGNSELVEKECEQQGLVIDKDGRYIYNVVRGPNVVTVFEVDQESGAAKPIQYMKIPGKWPRGCAISPDGRYLLVCCLDSAAVIEFKITEDGRLSETGREYSDTGAAYAVFVG